MGHVGRPGRWCGEGVGGPCRFDEISTKILDDFFLSTTCFDEMPNKIRRNASTKFFLRQNFSTKCFDEILFTFFYGKLQKNLSTTFFDEISTKFSTKLILLNCVWRFVGLFVGLLSGLFVGHFVGLFAWVLCLGVLSGRLAWAEIQHV